MTTDAKQIEAGPDAYRHADGWVHIKPFLHGGIPCTSTALECTPVWFVTAAQVAAIATGCECPPCPGRGNDGHGMTHCAECCFGSGVEADEFCPVHGRAAIATDGLADRIAEHVYLTLMQETRDHWTEWRFLDPNVKYGYVRDARALLSDPASEEESS